MDNKRVQKRLKGGENMFLNNVNEEQQKIFLIIDRYN